MRRSLLALLLAASTLCPPIGAQDASPPVLTQVVSRQDWDLGRLGEVRYGRVVIVAAEEGHRIELRRLLEEAPAILSPSSSSRTPPFEGNNLLVSDFGQSNRTPLGGFFGIFQRAPSSASASVERSPDGRRVLEVTGQRRAEGFCGIWVQLYDFEVRPDERAYLDAGGFSTLSFWIRGHSGGEHVLLKVADAEWERREDALPIGDVSEFLPSGRMETEWQQAVVPLDRFPHGIRRDMLAMVAFEVLIPGTATFDLGPMAFSLTPDSLPDLPPSVEPEGASPIPHRATWIWNTETLLQAPGEMNSLFDFLQGEGIDRVFLQIPGGPDREALPEGLAMDQDALRPMVAALTSRGMQVYALDGYARYALPEFHEGVLSTIDHVAEYNESVLPNERFLGVRYDIEPYLLPQFHGPNRDELLTNLLQLTAASVDRAQAAGLVYGADIPFWYDAPSEDTFESVSVSFRGVEKPVSEHIIDLADDVSVMDYRTAAFGADGTVRHGQAELEYAHAVGKPVFIALETFQLPDEVLLDFRGEPKQGLPSSTTPSPIVIAGTRGDSIYTALLGNPSETPGSLDALPEWLQRNQLLADDVWWWSVNRRVEVPASKITFAGMEPNALEEVMQSTAHAFREYDSFAGFAIHFAESYRAYLRR